MDTEPAAAATAAAAATPSQRLPVLLILSDSDDEENEDGHTADSQLEVRSLEAVHSDAAAAVPSAPSAPPAAAAPPAVALVSVDVPAVSSAPTAAFAGPAASAPAAAAAAAAFVPLAAAAAAPMAMAVDGAPSPSAAGGAKRLSGRAVQRASSSGGGGGHPAGHSRTGVATEAHAKKLLQAFSARVLLRSEHLCFVPVQEFLLDQGRDEWLKFDKRYKAHSALEAYKLWRATPQQLEAALREMNRIQTLAGSEPFFLEEHIPQQAVQLHQLLHDSDSAAGTSDEPIEL